MRGDAARRLASGRPPDCPASVVPGTCPPPTTRVSEAQQRRGTGRHLGIETGRWPALCPCAAREHLPYCANLGAAVGRRVCKSKYRAGAREVLLCLGGAVQRLHIRKLATPGAISSKPHHVMLPCSGFTLKTDALVMIASARVACSTAYSVTQSWKRWNQSIETDSPISWLGYLCLLFLLVCPLSHRRRNHCVTGLGASPAHGGAKPCWARPLAVIAPRAR